MVKGGKFEIREGKYDEIIIREVARENLYLKPLKLRRSDRVLDVGAHIGSFSILASKFVRHIWAFEPSPREFELLRKNLALNAIVNVTSIDSALWCEDGWIDFYLAKTNTGNGTTLKKRGRECIRVIARDVNGVIDRIQPNKIKMDCEGSEIILLPAIKDWSGVERIAIEFHFNMISRQTRLDHYHETVEILKKNFDGVKEPNREKIDRAWTRMIYAWKGAS